MKSKRISQTMAIIVGFMLFALISAKGQDPLYSIKQEYCKWYAGDYYPTVRVLFDVKQAYTPLTRQKSTYQPKTNISAPYKLKYDLGFMSYISPHQHRLNSNSWWLVAEEYVFYQELIFGRTLDVCDFQIHILYHKY